jgi:hypothetical protein
MGLKELSTKYQNIAKELAESRQRNGLLIASDGFALVANRVQNTGVDMDGQKMPLYSEGYKALRKSLGLPVDKRTLTFSGDMFSDIRPEIIEHNDEVTIIEIKARASFNQAKINFNSKTIEKSIIGFSKEDKAFITEANQKRIQKIFDKYK